MPLTTKLLNPKVVKAEYAVRGALAIRAEELREEISRDPNSHPFDVINANIGNPQQLDQKPVTFYRQVLAMVQCPQLIEQPPAFFKRDAVSRAQFLLKHIGSVGAYSTSNGIPVIRESVARYIEQRDGYPASPENIFLVAGASSGVANMIRLLSTEKAGIMIPIPQYPLYSATLALEGAAPVYYYLDEDKNWTLTPNYIEDCILKAKDEGIEPRMLVIINPGNPTGAVIPASCVEDLLKLAHKYDLVLMADEVYQANVFMGEFTSFKKGRSQLVEQDKKYDSIQLVSMHSTSKGYIGECGQRGGYMEVVGFKKEIVEQIYKMASISLCPVVTGQVLTELMVNPPKPGDESYDEFKSEVDAIRDTLTGRAKLLYDEFEKLDGVTCNPPQGAMYLFPRISLPDKAIAEAKKQNVAPDAMYCMDLLNATGICVVPGSGFGQKEGTFHFRSTFLAPGGKDFSDRFVKFHNEFIEKWK